MKMVLQHGFKGGIDEYAVVESFEEATGIMMQYLDPGLPYHGYLLDESMEEAFAQYYGGCWFGQDEQEI